jgi:hypothetical protein
MDFLDSCNERLPKFRAYQEKASSKGIDGIILFGLYCPEEPAEYPIITKHDS